MLYACGIDWHARSAQVCVIDRDHKKLVEKKTGAHLHEVIALIEPFKEDLEVVVESTAYWYRIIDGLIDADFDVRLAHPLGLHLITQAKVKTDRRDAFRLAQLLLAGMIPEAYIYPREIRPARDLLRERNRIVMRRAEEYRSLQQLLIRDGYLDATHKDLIEAWGDDELQKFFEEPFVQMHARHELERVDLLGEQIFEMEEAIREVTRKDADFLRLQTAPGIGEMLGLTVRYEIGSIVRFESERHFSSYSRVVPGTADSAGKSKRGRGSKQGNAYLKWAFTQAAIAAVRCYPPVAKYFNRQLRRHKGRYGKLIAYNNVAHKLAIATFHMLRDKVDFNMEKLFGK